MINHGTTWEYARDKSRHNMGLGRIDLFADDDGATRIQDGLIVLVGVACLAGDDIHIGAVFALAVLAFDNGSDAR